LANLSLEHVSCSYRTRKGVVRALDDLSLQAAERELIVLVGPSGCGKTTTLRLIAGLEQPSSGVVRIGDRTVNEVAPRDRDVSMVFQNYALYPHMTVYKNLAFGLKMRRVAKPQIEQAVKQVAAKLGLTALLERKPHQLSGGEKQRVALGRAIVRKPQLFLLDEPLSNLDVSMRISTRAEIKFLQRELATTMVYVTHDQEEAMTLADRIGVLDFGKLQQFGAPLEIYNRPANRFVAGFFGSPPMNLLTGEIGMEDGRDYFQTGQLRFALTNMAAFQGDTSRQVVAGIRPHEIELSMAPAREAVNRNLHGSGIVRSIEPLGDSVTVRIELENGPHIVAKTGTNTTLTAGQAVDVVLPLERLHFFAADDAGTRLN
jgi:multiple sugar transport system ATP-binding protein